MKKTIRYLWRAWVKPFALFFVIMAPLRSALVDWNWVPSGSMKPTILEGDLVLVNKLSCDLKVPFTTSHLMQWGDPAQFRRDVFEDPNPVVAVEHLGSCDHYVMALPGRPALRSFGPYLVPRG